MSTPNPRHLRWILIEPKLVKGIVGRCRHLWGFGVCRLLFPRLECRWTWGAGRPDAHAGSLSGGDNVIVGTHWDDSFLKPVHGFSSCLSFLYPR